MTETNGLLSLSADFDIFDPSGPGRTYVGTWPRGHRGTIGTETLELRLDLIQVNQDNAFAWLGWILLLLEKSLLLLNPCGKPHGFRKERG